MATFTLSPAPGAVRTAPAAATLCKKYRRFMILLFFQTRRSASCVLRARLAWLVMRPKSVAVGVRFGGLNDGWFRKLKNSHRNCRLTRSVMLVFLMAEKSRLFTPS